MSQHHVELLIGRLLTDEALLAEFTRAPYRALAAYLEQGWQLTSGEVRALAETDPDVWVTAAAHIPQRLRRHAAEIVERRAS